MLRAAVVANNGIGTGVACGLLAAAIWGAWPVVSRLGVQQAFEPLDIAVLRFGVAGLLLLPVVCRYGVRGIGWPRALFLSVGAGVPYVLVMVGGLTMAPAGHAGVITPSCMLAFSTLGGWLFLKDKPGSRRLVGLAMVFAGIWIVGWEALYTGDERAWLGDLMFAAGGLLWASYTVAARAWSATPFHATALVSVISMALVLPVYMLAGVGSDASRALWSSSPAELLLQAVAQGVFAAVLALFFYSRSVAILGAGRGAVFAALVPVVAVVLAIPVLGEIPSWLEWLGVSVVTAGMCIALGLRFRRPARTILRSHAGA